MANKYFKAVGGTWATATNWSTVSSAGTDTGGVPTAADQVYLDSGSGNLTIGAAGVCRALNCSGYTGTITHNAYTITIGDSTYPVDGIALLLAGTYNTASASSAFVFASSAAGVHSVNYASKTVGNQTFSGSASYQLLSNFTTKTAATALSHTNGTLDFGAVVMSGGLFQTTGTSSRTLTLGSSTLELSQTGAAAFTYSGSGLSITTNTATIVLTGASPTIALLSANWNGLSIKIVGTAGTVTITGTSPTIKNLYIRPSASKTLLLPASSTITCTDSIYISAPSSEGKVTLNSSSAGVTATLRSNLNNVYLQGCYITDINIYGDIEYIALNSYSGGNNTNITCTPAIYYMDPFNGSDSVSTNPYGWWSVTYTTASGSTPAIDTLVSGVSSGAVAYVSFVDNYEWEIVTAGTIYLYGKAGVFQAETATCGSGSSFVVGGDLSCCAWKTAYYGATAARLSPGDTIRIAKSMDPLLLCSGTWHSASLEENGINIFSKLEISLDPSYNGFTVINNCDLIWTVANSSIITRLVYGHDTGGNLAKIQLPSSGIITNRLYGYSLVEAGATLDLSSYQRLSLWFYCSNPVLAGHWKICLCSDVAGATIVDTFEIPADTADDVWACLTLDKVGGGSLGSSIRSVALYTGTVAPSNSTFVYLDNIVACTTSGICLNSLVSKSNLPTGDEEGWYGIGSLEDFSYTKLLMHFDGTDGSTTFVNSAFSVSPITVYGNAAIKTNQSVFGGSSLFLDGTGDYLSLENHENWNFDSEDFTIECWYRPNALTGASSYPGIVCHRGAAGNRAWTLYLRNSNQGFGFECYDSLGAVSTFNFGGALSTGTWYHIAVSRVGNTIYTSVNGTVTSHSSSIVNVLRSSAILIIGRLGTSESYYVNGWIDELRIIKGVGLYTTNFTPPTEAYTFSVDYKVLYLLQNNDASPLNSRGYYGITEKVPTYYRTSIMNDLVNVPPLVINDSGTSTDIIQFQGGYNTATNIQDGETFFDGVNVNSSIVYMDGKSYITINRISGARYLYPIQITGGSHDITFQNITSLSVSGYCIYSRGADYNITFDWIGSLINSNYGIVINTALSYGFVFTYIGKINNNYYDGVHMWMADANYFHEIKSICNNGRTGIALYSGCFSNYFGVITDVVYNQTGIDFNSGDGSYEVPASNNTFKEITNIKDSLEYGISSIMYSDNNHIYSGSISNSALGGVYLEDSSLYLHNFSIDDTTEVVLGGTATKKYRLHSQAHDKTQGNNWVWTVGGTINSQTSVRHTDSGIAWKIALTTADRTLLNPIDLDIATIAVIADQMVTFRVWVKKDNATSVGAKLICKGNQIAGVYDDVVATKADDTEWERLSISFTPTEAGVIRLSLLSYYITGLSNIYVDDISVTQA